MNKTTVTLCTSYYHNTCQIAQVKIIALHFGNENKQTDYYSQSVYACNIFTIQMIFATIYYTWRLVRGGNVELPHNG